MGNKQSKNQHGKSSVKKFLQSKHNLDLNELLKNMFSNQADITRDYLVKSPPMGKSTIGEIREVYHKKFKRKNILKVLYLNMFNRKEIELILNEVRISQRLNHPNILEMIDYSYDAQNIYIIMEFFQGNPFKYLFKLYFTLYPSVLSPSFLLFFHSPYDGSDEC